MGPKRSENAAKGNKASLASIIVTSTTGAGGTTTEQEQQQLQQQQQQQCTGKFAADIELCCREPSLGYPVLIPVFIRGHSLPTPPPPPPPILQSSSNPSQSQLQQQYPSAGTLSGMSATPSVIGGVADDQMSLTGKKTSRSRVPSIVQSGALIGITGIDSDSRPVSAAVPEPTKVAPSPYKTFQLIDDSEFFRPKLLVDSVGSETEPIDQITALYIRAWQLDQRFIEILKRVLPLQEQLHTLNFCYVGLNQQTTIALVEVCQGIQNLKYVSLDGNPQASDYFYHLIENDDSKILHLSLRYCNMTDLGVERLANALGNMSKQNWKLLTLDLSGNRISDNGGKSLATALRYNRTLVSLNLSSNCLTDESAILFALATSPTPSTVSTKSKSGRIDWKRFTDPNKRKLNPTKIAQIMVDKRNRPESEENRPSSGRQSESKRGRNEGSASNRSSLVNLSSSTANTSRRTTTNPSNTNTKDSGDPPRLSGQLRVKKIAAAMNAATKKHIPIVKEEIEDQVGQGTSLHKRLIDRENPLLETNEVEIHNGEIWLRGNFSLISLNLSKNYLTVDTVKEFLLSIQHQSILSHFNEISNLSSSVTMASLMDFSGLCRLELKNMSDISTKSAEYQSLEAILSQKNPTTRFQQYKEREAKELQETQSVQQSQQLYPVAPEKPATITEKTRTTGKSTAQRLASRPKE
ncbi:unnamed protein product [Adineta ricciae]|uniref:Uncharacterized protein n=1 Tax=Adineta ricciae TaxID=249248 RepID=A0A814AIM6_ADIRI|nr:unnamed protein product [Adineta ricciae]